MEQIRGAVENLPGPLKLAIIAVVVGGILWFVWGAISDMMQNYEPIAVGLSGKQKSEVLNYLRSRNIKYKIEGDSILVPEKNSDELRIEMAGLDLEVTQLKGLERLNEVGMGDTEKTISAKKQLALQEELQIALNSLNYVDGSNVLLTLPQENSFIAKNRDPAKASIILRLKPSASLTSEQIRGIQNIVANSIQGLTPANVTITDQYSNPLTSPSDGTAQYSIAEMDEVKRIKQEVKGLLEPAVGVSGINVAASVEINMEHKRQTKREIDTNRAAETTFETTEEEEQGGAGVGGPPGAESNTGEETAGGGGQGGSSRTMTKEKRSTDYPTTLTETEILPGEIKRKSVSVVVDLKKQVTKDESGKDVVEYVSWGEETLNSWRETIKHAAGIDDRPVEEGGRGDTFSLIEVSFDSLHEVATSIEKEERSLEQRKMLDIFDWSDWTALIKIPLLITILFAIFWFVIKPIGKIILEPVLQLPSQAAAQIPEELPKTVEELEAEIEGKLEDEIDLASKEVTKGTILKKRIAELAKNEPEGFAQLLRTWLNE